MKMRLTEWLTLLKGQGFHPMLLSDVLRDIHSGRGVPEKTVVTVFSPGYRRTFEIVAPILARLEWPAVWLTDESSMRLGDRRLITYNTARHMKDSALWDIGFTHPNKWFRMESLRDGTFFIGDADHPSWTSSGGAFALNRGAVFHDMNFLTVNSAWLAPELLNRLLVEMPPTEGVVYLTKGIIQGREWGITLPSHQSALNPVFDVKARRSIGAGTRLYFLGTQRYSNFHLHVRSAHLVNGNSGFKLKSR